MEFARLSRAGRCLEIRSVGKFMGQSVACPVSSVNQADPQRRLSKKKKRTFIRPLGVQFRSSALDPAEEHRSVRRRCEFVRAGRTRNIRPQAVYTRRRLQSPTASPFKGDTAVSVLVVWVNGAGLAGCVESTILICVWSAVVAPLASWKPKASSLEDSQTIAGMARSRNFPSESNPCSLNPAKGGRVCTA